MRYSLSRTSGMVAVVALVGGAAMAARVDSPRIAVARPCMFAVDDDRSLSDAERADLLWMREEEKLARDVYLGVYEKWQHPAFRNIAQAEQRHMKAMGRMIELFELADPVTDDTLGTFGNQELAAAYAALMERGSASLAEAFQAGAEIEERDIVDLRRAQSATENAALLRVYGNLLRASRNHLRTFAGLIQAAGETYAATYLTQEEFDRIAASPHERRRGRGHCRAGARNMRRAGAGCCATPCWTE